VISTLAALGSLLGPNRPFIGKDLAALQATGTFVTSLITAILSGVGLYTLVKPWSPGQFNRVLALFLFAFLGFLTARVAIAAAYINYDYANELLVYAHSAPGVKTAMAQIEEISRRTTDGLALEVAYDNETSYPYWWYLRNYYNQRYYGETPTRSLRDVPVILVGDANFGKIEQVVGQSFNRFDYIRLWWPNQDYFGLTWERIWSAIIDPQMRAALFDIWLDRDYTRYSQLVGRDMSFPNWSPAARMRLYIRKDIIGQLWNYGVAPVAEQIEADPWDGKALTLMADQVIGGPGSEPGLFQNPRDLAVAPDGSIYVVDSDNHRVQHLSADGRVLHVWGSFADLTTGQAPPGTFNQPWGIGLGADGSVYIADTWNHRVQKFTPEGEFITMWGYFGQGEAPLAFWGPRDVAVDGAGRVYVTDTGNKRVVVFDENGNSLDQFGSAGLAPGQFDEPVGIMIDAQGRIYVADTWNQRVQTFIEDEAGFHPEAEWDVAAWYGQSLDNKPYLAVDEAGRVFASDPDGFRVLVFSASGEPLLFWGDYGSGLDTFGLPASVATDLQGGVWVTDARNGRLMHFAPPLPATQP
jgi:DNA-binding beta-propeller fold protein YncE